jgi:two-component system, chemotaxis family, CheB/CheR fusion protein
VSGDEEQEFDELLLMLKDTRGFDFTGYKRSTLMRRIKRRMDARGLKTVGEYRDHLELEPEEFARLFDSLLINVTGFFRDPPAWEALRDEILPGLVAAKGSTRPIRIWSAGCATGEEVYTLAILFVEALGTEDFSNRVKIYATDLDEDALRQARTGTYTERQIADVPEDLRVKYFEQAGTRHSFRRDLRRQVIFGRNDLTRDAPISRVDLLVARNTLMYFTADTQASVIRKFHFALSTPGYLFLGIKDLLLNHGDLFEPIDLRKRLFSKIPSGVGMVPRAQAAEFGADEQTRATRMDAAALAAGPVAQIALDRAGRLAVANVRAERLFNLHARDIGRLFQDLEVSFRPIELRSIIEQVKRDKRPFEITDVTWHRAAGEEATVLNVSVVPLVGDAGGLMGVGISFVDVTRYHLLRDKLERSNQDLERAYEELQSLNEELETTNEELHSTNEELETTNEELQSTNAELQAINDVLRMRTEELDAANGFFGSVLRSLGNAVIVVNEDTRVRVWSPGAEELWGLRADEAEGRHLLTLDIGLPVQRVVPMLQQMLTGKAESSETIVEALNRRARTVRLRVGCSLLRGEDGTNHGVILVMDHVNHQAEP